MKGNFRKDRKEIDKDAIKRKKAEKKRSLTIRDKRKQKQNDRSI